MRPMMTAADRRAGHLAALACERGQPAYVQLTGMITGSRGRRC